MSNPIDISVYQKEKAGNYNCGDSYYYYQNEDFFLCALADGLGSGDLAHQSSQAVMNVIKSNPNMTISEMVDKSNQALIGNRGVVLGIIKIDLKTRRYVYTSIGNIGLMTISSEGIKKRNIPMSGYLGVYHRELKEVNGFLDDDTFLVLFSDGVSPQELTHDLFKRQSASEITETFAARMEQRREDDTTLIVIKYS